MKQFFHVLFGGIGAVVAGILIAFAGKWAIDTSLAKFNTSNVANVVGSEKIDGTSVSGFKRRVSYVASAEEGLMRAATLSLPRASDIEISATSYIIQNLKNGKVWAEHESDRLLPIASLTKLVTASVAKKLIKDDIKIKMTKEIIDTYGNAAGLKVGESFNAGDLYYPLLMVSSNDAAEALARSYGRKQFIEAMNNFAQSIGAYRTSFFDPSGLSVNNKSTANDMVTIMTWVEKNNPDIIEITKLKSKTVRAHTWTNPTHFLSWSNYGGGKNGYTDKS
jgi:D-alanyl-D-alanine endopeptidase (penicillin-binding protein 7)